MTAGLDERIVRLYGLPPEQFTAERNALAAALRVEGDPAAAEHVKRLRKPTAAAWVVNQLVRAEPDLVEALLGAGGELRQAHRQAASGRGAEQLRAAAEAERAAVDALAARAADVLGRTVSATLADSVRNTLRAASSSDEARERVRTGTLTTELRSVGLGPAPTGPGAKPPAPKRADVTRLRAAKESEQGMAKEVEAASRALARADEVYARARETAEAAAARVQDARRRLRDARAGLEEARQVRSRLER